MNNYTYILSYKDVWMPKSNVQQYTAMDDVPVCQKEHG